MRVLKPRPRVTVVVMVYRMPRQAMNTLTSLGSDYQRQVKASDYEVVVVENESTEMLDAEVVSDLPGNFRYFRRPNEGHSPVPSVNFGVGQARASRVAVMIDGARMLTPGVVRGLLDAERLAASPVVSVPGYHLGDALHQDAVHRGYNADIEQTWLAELDWRSDGYRLFDRAVPSASCSSGVLLPMAESNCVGVSTRLFTKLGGFDEAFDTRGGGYVNLDFYKRAVESRGSTLVVLPGEGAFHQFHGGATTGDPETNREEVLTEMQQQYRQLRGQDYSSPGATGIMLGRIPRSAAGVLERSARLLGGSGA